MAVVRCLQNVSDEFFLIRSIKRERSLFQYSVVHLRRNVSPLKLFVIKLMLKEIVQESRKSTY